MFVDLARVCDRGVQDRLAAFTQQLGRTPEDATTDLELSPRVLSAQAICYPSGVVLSCVLGAVHWRGDSLWRELYAKGGVARVQALSGTHGAPEDLTYAQHPPRL